MNELIPPKAFDEKEPLDQRSRIRIVLSQPSHPGNIGAVARAMKTMGFSRLYLVAPRSDFPHPEASARAAGADDILSQAVLCADLDTALAGTHFALAVSARHRNLGPPPMPAREGAARAISESIEGEVALLFGNETSGLSNTEVMRCQASVFIPTSPVYSSLNLGAAVQILCYELRIKSLESEGAMPEAPAVSEAPLATLDALEGLYTHLENAMIISGFIDPKQPKRLMPKLRRLFSRARLERDEVNILRGIIEALCPAAQQKKDTPRR